jgi:hypothetical protein
MSGFKTQTKRNREAAKLAKRQAKDQKRALRKAEKAGEVVATPTAVAAVVPTPLAHARQPVSASKPLTLAEAVERWKNTKIAKPKRG